MPRLPAPLNRSLSLRLLAFAGIAIALALAAAWLVLGMLFERHSERQLQTELERHGLALIAGLETGPDGRPLLTREPADPRFTRPASGLYWRIHAPYAELRSRSLWDGLLPAPPPEPAQTGWRTFNARGPFEPDVLIAARNVQLDPGAPAMLVEVAADRRPVTAARAAFGQETAAFLAMLWFALAIAAWIQVRLGLHPLARIGAEVNAMTQAPDSRLSPHDHPREIRPLTQAINSFADHRADDVERARKRARDLAHALKTPITALRLQIDALPPDTAHEMAHSLSLLAGAVEGELARTGAVPSGQSAVLAPLIDRLTTVIARTPDGASLTFANDLPDGLAVPMAAESALETFGALIENAARHARSAVMITGAVDQTGGIMVIISDDGPGIPEALRAAALGRGVRLDERGVRHGLGLAIAQDFVTASGGMLILDTAPAGGLSVCLRWPQPPGSVAPG